VDAVTKRKIFTTAMDQTCSQVLQYSVVKCSHFYLLYIKVFYEVLLFYSVCINMVYDSVCQILKRYVQVFSYMVFCSLTHIN
jgi:hypothetical protein